MNSTTSDLYNPEVKERFLSTIESEGGDVKKVLGHLKKFAPVERKYGVDIAQMDVDDAIKATQELDIKSTSTLKNTLASTRKYARWCSSGSVLPNCNSGFIEMKPSDVEFSSPKIFFMNEDDLLDSLHQVCEFDEGKPEIPYMILCWLGLKKAEIMNLTDSQVDLDNKVILSPEKSVIVGGISDKLIEALRQYVSCDRVTKLFGNSNRTLIKDKSVTNFIKKMIPLNPQKEDSGAGVPYKMSAIDQAVATLNAKYKRLHPGYDKIEPGNAWDSGRLFRLFMKESEISEDITSPKNKRIFDEIMMASGKSRRSDYVSMYRKYREARMKWLEMQKNHSETEGTLSGIR